MKSNHILRTAVAACFGTMAAGAFAAVTVGGTTPVRVAKELPSTTTTLVNAANVLDLQVTMPAGAGATGTNPVFVKLALTNGAKFAGTPVMNCDRLTGAFGATQLTGNAFPSVVQNGGAGFSTVTFVITGDALGQDTTFSSSATCTAAGIDLTISGLTDIAVSATVEFTNGLLQASANANGSYVTFVDSFSATFSAGVTGLVVDATSGSDNFVPTSNLTQGTGVLGYLSFNRGGSAANSSTMGTSMSLANALDSASVTISGPAIAALKNSSSAGVYLTTDAGCATVVAAGHGFFDSTAATSVTFATATTAQVSAGFYVCGVVTAANTVVIGTGQITGQFGGTGVTGVTINFGAAGNLQNVSQNGSTKNAYFINASSSIAKTSVIRIVNTGGNSGTIRATAYLVGDNGAADGTAVGNANSTIGTLTANQSISLTSAQLEALLGYTPASGTVKYRVVFSAGLANFEVLNFTRDVGSGSISLSQSQTN